MTTITRRGLLLSGGALLAASALPRGARAQDWPSKAVRFIVPFPPGGPVDTTARAMTTKLAEFWGQPALVDNRAGAGGILGADVAAAAPADGYNFFVCSIHHSVLPSLKKQLPYDITKDFVPVSFGAMFPVILVVHPSLPVKSVPELIAYAKANPGKLSYSSAGVGGGTHLSAELFKSMAGVDMLHVPYKGSAPAMTGWCWWSAPTTMPRRACPSVRRACFASATIAVIARRPRPADPRSCRDRLGIQRQGDAETRPRQRPVHQFQRAVHPLHDDVADVQPQTQPR